MSTIAYRNGEMAADTKAYGGRYQASPGAKDKLYRLTEGPFSGAVFGVSSAAIGADVIVTEWLKAGAPLKHELPPLEDFYLLLVFEGKVRIAVDAYRLSGPIDCEFYAVGSGGQYAMGAMSAGADPQSAINHAAKFDPHTGGKVTVLTVR